MVGGFYRDVNSYDAVWRIDWVGPKVITSLPTTTWVVRWTRLQRTVFGFCNEEVGDGGYHFDPRNYKRVFLGP